MCQTKSRPGKNRTRGPVFATKIGPLGPALVTKSGLSGGFLAEENEHIVPKVYPDQFWLTKSGPGPVLAGEMWTQSGFWLTKTDLVQFFILGHKRAGQYAVHCENRSGNLCVCSCQVIHECCCYHLSTVQSCERHCIIENSDL